MKRRWGSIAAAGILAAVVSGLGIAQEETAPAVGEDQARKEDAAAIREASRAFARAFEEGDADAVAAFWTEAGEYQDGDGEPVRGRAALAKAYAGFFADRPELKVEGGTDRIRFLGQDTAVEEGTFIVRAKDATAEASRYSALYVREGGRWLIALLKEWGDEDADRANLEDLAWLIGTWESEGGDVRARTTYEWADNKTFILARYTIDPKAEGERTSSGRQVIGVDPSTGLVRAWTFDFDGGFGESTWTRDGGRWVIDSEGTLADGSHTTATNFLARAGDDGFTWRSVERTLDDEALPNVGPVKVRRVQEKK